MLHALQMIGALLALILIGMNIAFLVHLGNRLVYWFAFKIGAVTLLLAYVAVAFGYADPPWPRVALGLAAMCVDVIATGWMWRSIVSFAKRGVVGVVPLLRVRASDYEGGPRR